jgi:predicted neutral ceramidase superfamily lipid hydrolase
MNRRNFLKHSAMAATPAMAQYPQLHVEPVRMKAGFAEREITPKVDPAKIHDPLKVRAAVFDDGQRQAALVGVDALFVARPVVLAARRQIQERCGIPPRP